MNFRKVGEKHGYSFSLMKTNTELHGIPQKRIRTFYFFWNTPTVPELTYKYKKAKTFSNYLKEIPKSATQQDMFLTPGKASVRFRPYQFVLLKEGLTHRYVNQDEHHETIVVWNSNLMIPDFPMDIRIRLAELIFFVAS